MVKDDSLLQNQIKRVPEYGLRRFFETLVGRSFQELWVWDPELAGYVVDVLVRFVRTDALYRMGDIQRRPLDTVAELLLELSVQQEEKTPVTELHRTRDLRQHTGDYALFMSGMFRVFLERHRILDSYLVQGSRAYRDAALLDRKLYRPNAHCFEALASDFQRVSGALDYMRKVYLGPAARNSPYRDLLDQFDRIC
jgi:hypothetical protein